MRRLLYALCWLSLAAGLSGSTCSPLLWGPAIDVTHRWPNLIAGKSGGCIGESFTSSFIEIQPGGQRIPLPLTGGHWTFDSLVPATTYTIRAVCQVKKLSIIWTYATGFPMSTPGTYGTGARYLVQAISPSEAIEGGTVNIAVRDGREVRRVFFVRARYAGSWRGKVFTDPDDTRYPATILYQQANLVVASVPRDLKIPDNDRQPFFVVTHDGRTPGSESLQEVHADRVMVSDYHLGQPANTGVKAINVQYIDWKPPVACFTDYPRLSMSDGVHCNCYWQPKIRSLVPGPIDPYPDYWGAPEPMAWHAGAMQDLVSRNDADWRTMCSDSWDAKGFTIAGVREVGPIITLANGTGSAFEITDFYSDRRMFATGLDYQHADGIVRPVCQNYQVDFPPAIPSWHLQASDCRYWCPGCGDRITVHQVQSFTYHGRPFLDPEVRRVVAYPNDHMVVVTDDPGTRLTISNITEPFCTVLQGGFGSLERQPHRYVGTGADQATAWQPSPLAYGIVSMLLPNASYEVPGTPGVVQPHVLPAGYWLDGMTPNACKQISTSRYVR